MERREELLYWVWMAEALGAGSRLGIVLLRELDTVRRIYKQKPEKAAEWNYLTAKEKSIAAEMLRQKDLTNADRILTRCDELGIHVVNYEEAGYPESLRSLPNAPLVLYYKGNLPLIDKRFTTAVVGTRTMSEYGRNMAYSMGYGLAAGGALVISGMALGIDSVAMMGALDAGGSTVGVLGCGVDIVYPREHAQVYRRILESGGCILSEYSPGTEPKGAHFPIRNRIISGLSDCGVVVEGDAHSGALITARHLVYQGRKVFAVPGQVGLPGSEGPNNLIRDGALPAVTAEDVLCEYAYMFPDSIDVNAAHRAYRHLDVENSAQHTVKETGVGNRNSRNYVGTGTYGGKNRNAPERAPIPAAPNAAPPAYPEWMYEGAAKVVAEMEAAGKPEKTAEVPAKKKAEVPVQKDSVLTRLKRTLQKETAEEAEKPVETKKKSIGKQKDTEKIQPAHKKDTEMLDETEMRVYNSMKPNVPMMPDELVAHGFTIGQVMAAMTALEMAGVIEAGSGGYFLRIDPDDFPVQLVEDTELEEKQ